MSNHEMLKEVNDKYSLRGRVFHTIREDILNGRYRQEEELRETAIGAELGVSLKAAGAGRPGQDCTQ